jgi:hypothetical protein
MELTPEERQRIYQEEKARLEVRQELQPPKKSDAWKIILGIVLFLVIIALIGNLSEQVGTGSKPTSADGSVKVTYYMTSEVPVEVSYTNETNGMDHLKANVEWDKTIDLPPGVTAFVTAQNQDDHGRVMVRIDCNGEEVKRSESNGAYAIASAAARCN